MGTVTIRPRIHRESPIETNGLQIGTRGDRWEEEFIKNIDFSTMDNPTDWSYLFKDSKAYDFDLSGLDSSTVTNMDYMFNGTHASTLRLAGLTVGAQTSASYLLSGSFDAVDFTGVTFYSLPQNMFNGATITQGLQLRTLNVSNLTSLAGMFSNAQLTSLDLTGFDIHTITNLSSMFSYASITTLTGLNTLNYSNVVDANGMFYCSRIPEIDLSEINFASLENATNMFYVGNTDQAKTVDLSNTSFPVLVYAEQMFYSYSGYGAPPRDPGLHLILAGTNFSSSGIYAHQMFGYLYEPNGLNLNCLSNTKILTGTNMFCNAALGETDFTPLDFSQDEAYYMYQYYSNPSFYYCYTPIIHIDTTISYAVTEFRSNPFIHYAKADECILELTMHSTMSKIEKFVCFESDGDCQSYLIKNCDLYASTVTYFIYGGSSYYSINVDVDNSTLHIGNNGSLSYFVYAQGGGVIDLRDLVIDGIVNNVNSLCRNAASGNLSTTVYFPTTGIKFSGSVQYLFYGSYYDLYATYYNIDKFDMSRVQYFSNIFQCMIGTYDLTSWDVSSVQNINSYLIEHCEGNFDLSGWRTSSLLHIGYALVGSSSGNFNLSNWDVSNVQVIDGLASGLNGHLDIRNWNLTNCTYLYGATNLTNDFSIDFDGWVISQNQNMSNCYLVSTFWGQTDFNGIIYLPNTLYKPSSYTSTMFSGYAPTEYQPGNAVVDVYTNATNIEDQGWTFYHIYSAEEPYGYRIHLGTTHTDFLEAIGGDE